MGSHVTWAFRFLGAVFPSFSHRDCWGAGPRKHWAPEYVISLNGAGQHISPRRSAYAGASQHIQSRQAMYTHVKARAAADEGPSTTFANVYFETWQTVDGQDKNATRAALAVMDPVQRKRIPVCRRRRFGRRFVSVREMSGCRQPPLGRGGGRVFAHVGPYHVERRNEANGRQ